MATIFDELMSQSALLTRNGKKAKNESIRKIYYKNIKVESIKRLVNEEVDSDLDFDIPEDIEDLYVEKNLIQQNVEIPSPFTFLLSIVKSLRSL